VTPAVVAAERARIAFELLSYEHDPASESYGLEAAAALGVDPAHVFKTLVTQTDAGKLAVALVPVAATLDLKAMAHALRAKRVAMADVGLAERTTGYVAGGISPLGQRKALPTVIDASAERLARMYVSAGRRGLELALAPADLARLTRAAFAEVARAAG
jgi:Cys-tRNA(Pro)/Cys-tRNA(Cys) deacylase